MAWSGPIAKRWLVVVACALAALGAGCASAVTGAPSQVTAGGAVVDGQVVSNSGGEVEYWVQYGPTSAYGSESGHATVAVEPNAPAAVRVAVSDLTRSTLYHYRLCARQAQESPSCGADAILQTQSFGCGETVTSDVRLTGSVSCYLGISAPSLVVGAAGVEIDLNGHSLTGPMNDGRAPAIDNSRGFDDLTVRNGSVAGPGDGIHVEEADRTRILDVAVTGQDGIDIRGGVGHEIRRATARGRAAGISVESAARVTIADSKAVGNAGIGLREVASSRVVGNTVVPDGGTACCVSVGIGLWGDDNLLSDNRVGGYHDGNFLLAAGADNVLIGNEAFDGAIPVDPVEPDQGGDGFFIGAAASGTLLRANNAHDNSGDGIEIRSTAARLSGNRVTSNDDLGIDAAAGGKDLGANTASYNAGAPQCRNVRCR